MYNANSNGHAYRVYIVNFIQLFAREIECCFKIILIFLFEINLWFSLVFTSSTDLISITYQINRWRLKRP